MASSKLSLKLLIDTKGKRVIFAEADKDFVDLLFNILSLPIGTVIKLLTKESMVGCLGNVYQSIESLSQTYMQPNMYKNTLLDPQTVPLVSVTNHTRLLLPNAISSNPRNFYLCQCCRACYSDVFCPHCKNHKMNTIVSVFEHNYSSGSGESGGYVKGVVKYIVTDDLVVSPMSTNSFMTLLQNLNGKDVGPVEERVIDFGRAEAVELLKASVWQSKAILTTIFLGKKEAK